MGGSIKWEVGEGGCPSLRLYQQAQPMKCGCRNKFPFSSALRILPMQDVRALMGSRDDGIDAANQQGEVQLT